MRQQIQAGISQSRACAESYFSLALGTIIPSRETHVFHAGFRIKEIYFTGKFLPLATCLLMV